jgi:hypothetical protein
MRTTSRRFAATLADPSRWVTSVDWSNDGGVTWTPATFVSGTVTESALSQTRWRADLSLSGVTMGRDGISPYTTRLRVRHGQPGEMLDMGRYRVVAAGYSSSARSVLSVTAESYESYLRSARLPKPRTIYGGSSRVIVESLIREILPSAAMAWQLDDEAMPTTVIERDRWAFIDGPRDVTSVARRLGGRVYAGPTGDWVARPVPTLADDPAWEAAEGPGGVLLSHGETLSSEGVYNAVSVQGAPDNPKRGWAGRVVVVDSDPQSPTYFYRSPDHGGFGPCPRFYSSGLFTAESQAYRMGSGVLAQTLGLRQDVTWETLHDPRLQPGDVGIVHTALGPRTVLLDEVVHDLDGGPTSGTSRTVTTTETGGLVDVLDDAGE